MRTIRGSYRLQRVENALLSISTYLTCKICKRQLGELLEDVPNCPAHIGSAPFPPLITAAP